MRRKRTNRANRLDRGYRSPSIYSRTERIEEKGGGKTWLFVLLIIILLSMLCYLIFFSGKLKINNVEINGTKYVDRGTIQNRVNDYEKSIINNNLLTFYIPKLKRELGSLDGVKTVTIKKKYPNTLTITIEEKVPALAWETINVRYMVDDAGVLFGSFDEKFKEIPLVYDSKNVPIQVGKAVVSPSFCKFVNEMNRDFNTQTGVKITRIEVPEITAELKVTTDAGWYVLFDTTRTANGQLNNLNRVISEAKSKKKKLEYVDLRIDNKIFYK